MDTLIRFGFSIEEIQSMMDTNHSIEEVLEKDIVELITILKEENLSTEQIKNILICNPFYLSREIHKIKKTIQKIKEITNGELKDLLESNPYLLNVEEEELDRFYNEKIHEGLSKDEIYKYIIEVK